MLKELLPKTDRSQKSVILSVSLFLLGTVFVLSGGGGGGGNSRAGTYNDLTITDNIVWSNKTITVNGKLTIAPGGSLTLKNVTLNLNPKVEDSDTIAVNNGTFIAKNSTLRSSSGKQWNLEAHGSSHLTFENTFATNHTGIRAHDDTALTATGSEIEEVQCHDNAAINILDGSAVYIVLFFNGATEELLDKKLESGDGISRSFKFNSSKTTTGYIEIVDSDVWGFQLDLMGPSNLKIEGGTEIVLALHLESIGSSAVNNTITSDTQQTGSFTLGSLYFDYTNSQISYINVYLGGDSNVTFTGKNKVVECNVFDKATLTFKSDTELIADLAQAYDQSTLTLDGVKLISDDSHPSITAMDDATVNINNVTAIAGTKVYAVGNGTVNITGGDNWVDSLFEETENGVINKY